MLSGLIKLWLRRKIRRLLYCLLRCLRSLALPNYPTIYPRKLTHVRSLIWSHSIPTLWVNAPPSPLLNSLWSLVEADALSHFSLFHFHFNLFSIVLSFDVLLLWLAWLWLNNLKGIWSIFMPRLLFWGEWRTMRDVLTLRRSVKLRIWLFLHLYIYYIQLPSIILSAFLMYFNLALFTILKFFISFLFLFHFIWSLQKA